MEDENKELEKEEKQESKEEEQEVKQGGDGPEPTTQDESQPDPHG